jgi:CheY-like chemotaxis protein/PAS domain-containing protein
MRIYSYSKPLGRRKAGVEQESEHVILNRQLRALLKRLGIEDSKAPSPTQWVSLLSYLNDHFRVNEDEKHRLNRSLEIHGREIQSLYKELVLERERLSSAIGCLQIGFVIFDKSGQVSLMNAEAEQYLGWTESEAATRDLISLLGLNQFVETSLPSFLKTGQSLTGFFGLQTKGGELYETNLQLQPILRDGSLVGSVLTFDTEESSSALAHQQGVDRNSLSETLQEFIDRLSMWLEADPSDVVARHLSSLLHRTEEALGVATRKPDYSSRELVGVRENRALQSGERTQEEQPAVREASLEVILAEPVRATAFQAAEVEVRTSPSPSPKVKPPSQALTAAVKSAAEKTRIVEAPAVSVVSHAPVSPTKDASDVSVSAEKVPGSAIQALPLPESDSTLLSEIPILFTSEELDRLEHRHASKAEQVSEAPIVAAPSALPLSPVPSSLSVPPVRPAPAILTPPVIARSQPVSPPMAPIAPAGPPTQAPASAPVQSLAELTSNSPVTRPPSSLGATAQENRPRPASKDLPLRVLLVEDEPVSQLVTQSQLGQLGHECTVASDATEAIRLYQHQPFDAVISSYLMPGMNGIELCRKIREDARGGYTYFILLTAVERKDEAAKALEAGVDAFLTKPLDPNELAIRLKVARGVQSRLNRVYSELPDQRG